MKYLLAPDSFKEAASAQAVAEAMRRGVLAGDPDAECRMMPLSDGGEGLTTALVRATGGELKPAHVHDALGRPICTQYGFLGGGSHMETDGKTDIRTAVVELAAASGIEHVSPAERDPLAASTYGTGELIHAAIDAGATRIVLGLGGSATTDGGTGLARALGYRFLDDRDCELPIGGGALHRLARIDGTDVPNEVRNVPIILACDVTNPLTGPNGAAAVFAPQKGADAQQVALLDSGLSKLANAIEALNGRNIASQPGSGAAGGTGGGMLGLFNASMRPGIELVLDLLHARGPTWSSPAKAPSTTRRHMARCPVVSHDWRNRRASRPLPSEAKWHGTHRPWPLCVKPASSRPSASHPDRPVCRNCSPVRSAT